VAQQQAGGVGEPHPPPVRLQQRRADVLGQQRKLRHRRRRHVQDLYKHCYSFPMSPPDLLDSSYYGPLFRLLADMDADIAGLYAEAGIEGVRTRFVGPMIELGRGGPLTIKEIAERRKVSHSAMSQTVAAMRKAGLVEPAEDSDGRKRRVQLTARSRELLPFLRAEWRATEATVLALDAELPYPIMRAVADIQAALRARPFAQRLRDHLAGEQS
jgi:DNA-binding MarR family transcriptional regulator